jgi:hypothetical protein
MSESQERNVSRGRSGGALEKDLGGTAGRHPGRGVTPRAFTFGILLSAAVGMLANTVRFAQHGSYMAFSHMPMSNFVLFLLSMLLFAALARWFGRWFVFSQTEWITIFSMGLVGAYGPTYGVSGYLVGIISAPYYFASPENQWSEYLHPYLPSWLVPTNESGAMSWFYEGLPGGAAIPWNVWTVPLISWFILICAVGFACVCASVIIHRQWSDNEKLIYPMITPIAELTAQAGTGRRVVPEIMVGKAFWTGFILILTIFCWNMISWFYPHVPTFPVAQWNWIFYSEYYPPIFINLSTVVICFSYFASLEVLFSIWFFDILYIFEAGALNRLGLAATSPHYTTGSFRWQTTGAFVALVLWWVWISRPHLREVFQKALHPDRSPTDDSRELLSYRTALIGLVLSCLYVATWLNRIGIDLRLILLLIPFMLILFLGVTKVVVDSGLIYTNPPTSAWNLSVTLLGGAEALKGPTNAVSCLAWFPMTHYRAFLMMPLVHINRLADSMTQGKRRLFWALSSAFVVGMVTSTLYNIWLGYTIGGYNFRPNWLIIGNGPWQYQKAVSEVLSPTPVVPADYGFFLGGAAGMVLINLMRYRFSWWPLHPVGFALSGMSLTRLTSTTIFIAWAAKYLTIRIAGASFYRETKPFFYGVLIGYILAVALGIVVDSIWFPNHGHRVHQWF